MSPAYRNDFIRWLLRCGWTPSRHLHGIDFVKTFACSSLCSMTAGQ